MAELTALFLIIALVGLLAFAATRPDHFRIERSIAIEAKPEAVFAIVNDFHNWEFWSPWHKHDPAMRITFSGAPSGIASVYEWDGNKKVGRGRMEITAVEPGAKVHLKLDFFAPFEAHNTGDYTITAQGEKTIMTWAMEGKKPFMLKLMGLFFSMDKMVGKDFEEGLANLKRVVEAK